MVSLYKNQKKSTGLMKIKGNVFLSKNDPNFFQKLLNELPPSVQHAFDDHNNLPNKVEVILEDKKKISGYEQARYRKRLFMLMSFIMLLMFSMTGVMLSAKADKIQGTILNLPVNEKQYAQPTSEEMLKVAVVSSAVEYFHKESGFYPQNGEELTQKTPANWISFIPKGTRYLPNNNGYRVLPTEVDSKCTCQPELLELAFYEDTNQLALIQNEKVLALYSVASGKSGSELPFSASRITERVIDPNGGKGVFGTRALVLEGGEFAIHGTDQESLVGKKVSHGCLRMKNKDIEQLYPYVSIGMPFKVKSGIPSKPIYSQGLPSLGKEVTIGMETKSKKTFHWNG
jgi:hypothetical protein